METMLYPTHFAPLAEEELTYISGGAASDTDDSIMGAFGAGFLIGTAGSFALSIIIGIANSNRERQRYEQETGLPSRDADGNDTTDFANYYKRGYQQGLNTKSGSVMDLASFLMIGSPIVGLVTGLMFASSMAAE